MRKWNVDKMRQWNIEKMERELEERKKAHAEVCKNVLTMDLTPGASGSKRGANKYAPPLNKKPSKQPVPSKGLETKVSKSTFLKPMPPDWRKNPRQDFVESIKLGKDDMNEVYPMSMERKVPVGSPKPSQPKNSLRKPINLPPRPDPIGMDLMKFDSHKKLQNFVDRDLAKAGDAPGKNKNLERISVAFKKKLDKYVAKQDVHELINIPEDGHIEKMEQELQERRKAHESVFKNAITMDQSTEPPPPIPETKRDVNNNVTLQSKKELNNPKQSVPSKGLDSKVVRNLQVKAKSISEEPKKNAKSDFMDSIKVAQDDEDEVYSIIKKHMEYEMAAGPPKLSQPRNANIVRRPAKNPPPRPDQTEKVLMKYDSHKKLQNLVDSFNEKIGSSTAMAGPSERRHHVPSDTDEDENNNSAEKRALSLVGVGISSVVSSQTTLDSRKKSSLEVSGTLSRSMKTIGKASSVAQRLGTLMNRVALRNEAYEREKQEKEEERERLRRLEQLRIQKESELQPTDINNNPFPPPSTAPGTNYAIKRQSTHTALQANEYSNIPNPYELSQESPPAQRRSDLLSGVSKLDSAQFGKYVEQMKVVAEKAAESFEKFRLTQVQDDDELHSFSEGEEEEENYDYKSNQEAFAVAASAAEIAHRHKEIRIKPEYISERNQWPGSRAGKMKSSASNNEPVKLTKATDVGTSPREFGTGLKSYADILNAGNTAAQDQEFKFIPDMSYTDQLLLQKLRKMKEKEGWGDSLSLKVSELMEESENAMENPPPTQQEIESMVKKATNTDLTKQTEKGGLGAVISLNARLRARMAGDAAGSKTKGGKR